MPKRALITGGAGFIGSHLAEQLLAEGMQVTILDDLSTGRFENIAGIEARDDVQIIIDTVFNESLVADLIQNSDVVFHLASAVGVKLIIDQPVKTIETIVGGTEIVLRHCSRFRRPVLITSTSEVYGKGAKIPFHEDDDLVTGATCRHRWAYACSKTLDEFLALAHHRETHLPVAIVRLFNTVGPRQTGQYGMVVPNFVQSALKGKPLVVHGDGEQARCFAHVADVVTALTRVMSTPACYGKVVNIGNNEEVSINRLAERVIELTASTSEIQHIGYDEAYGDGFEDMQRRVPCLQRAAELIGYHPIRDLEQIIRDVADSFSAEP
ncbi:Bifunctional polymyxin resistance protein ArnA [Rosistilla carotiformis]|uniref:Bifunctional polymyxin resistance protein ArnA n=1 Tax=Rosistilla carotiformis TaxID=2528017 RepID=A0A518JSF3_9BACT|nr:NAD-dependent epimerase/dehydratase family protein [Rosistilla carotiformis]QDV68479.1 Bifunctional polymyxin resistance protein ArnA [Rosistilla carotiformis]